MATRVVAYRTFAWTTIAAAAGMVMATLAAVPAHAGDADAGPEEAMPDTDDRLTVPELRWCMFESVRLDGQRDALDRRKSWEVENYNSQSGVYRDHCFEKEFLVQDGTEVELELASGKRQTLREQGASRVKEARAEREARRVHIKDESATVHAAPDETAAALGRVPRWGDLIKTGRVQGPWSEVMEWQKPSPGRALTFGWVLGGLLEGGSGEEARFAYCEEHTGGRAEHNDVVRNDIDLHTLSGFNVENGLNEDAYVKLVREHDKAVVSLYVAAGQTASLQGMTAGSYEIAYATGSSFSRGCDSFSRRGGAQRFAERIDFGHRAVVWTVTLHGVSDGHARASSMSYDDFDRL